MPVERELPSTAPSASADSSAGVEKREVLLLDADLFFVVKVTETLRHAGYTTRTVRNQHDFARALAEHRPLVALVNTAARGIDFTCALGEAREAAVPSVAYGSHVDMATQQAARDAGATIVISNSRLAADLSGIIMRALRRGANEATDADF